MLAIELAFLTGRYVATAFDDRNEAEWPPHPARLFSALAATHFESDAEAEAERAALEWLAAQGAPEIAASDADHRDVMSVFVPVNDASVVAALDDEAAELAAARAELAQATAGKAAAAAQKRVDKAEARFREALRRATAAVAPGKERREEWLRAASILPERRGKQQRTFPSVRPHQPRVMFTWPKATPTSEQAAALDALLARLVRLGHSASLVAAWLGDGARPIGDRWVPEPERGRGARPSNADERVPLRVVEPDQLAMLADGYARTADEPGRVMPASFRHYVRAGEGGEAEPVPSCFGDDWLVLARVGGARLPMTSTAALARTVRKALFQAYGEGAPELLSGHRPEGAASERPHLAFVPLPWVASDGPAAEYADGQLLGVALVFPRESTAEERRAVYVALNRWEARERDDNRDNDNSDEPPQLRVFRGREGTIELARYEPAPSDKPKWNLTPAAWCGPARRWVSATPVALDRNPGELRAHDPAKEAGAFAAAEETIRLACARIGLEDIGVAVTVTPAALIAGATKVRRFPPFTQGRPPVQRVLVHASLEFEKPVKGPVLLGAGRYFGLGLFRPVADHD